VRAATIDREEAAVTDDDGFPAPEQGLVVTYFLTVRDVRNSREFYAGIFGGRVVLAENPATVRIANTWIIMNPGGEPTPDKPDVTLTPPRPGDPVSAFLNVRVADIAAFYAEAGAKGAHFLTPPQDRKSELRCYLRDPDGYLIEIGQTTGLLNGVSAESS
jgi:catechol 2,3-dioxygenase-like lactoylglutathione lyase family enzyme